MGPSGRMLNSMINTLGGGVQEGFLHFLTLPAWSYCMERFLTMVQLDSVKQKNQQRNQQFVLII